MNPPSKDICTMLEGESSLGLTFTTDLFVGKEPSSPDNCVTVFDTPGFSPQLTYTKGEDYYYPSVQIRVRNNSYLVGWDLINDIKVLLHGYEKSVIGGSNYELVRCSSEPALLDYDENGRARFIINFDLQRK